MVSDPDDTTLSDLTVHELEELIDEKVEEQLGQLESALEDSEGESNEFSRRSILGALGLGAGIGTARGGSGSTREQERDSLPSHRSSPRRELAVESVTANQVDAVRIDADRFNAVRYAETADEIQPAIDELAEHRPDGSRGGVVKLGPKVYRPETTIWLKAGVMLEGARPGRHTIRRDRDNLKTTVISTEELDNEWTFEHNADHPHPHYPVVANYRTPPMALEDREPTEEELEYWGHNVGLRDVLIDGTAKRRWSHDKTYFGVYDATLFSRSDNLYLENVETRGFDGYGLFVNGCRNVRDLGGKWRGGATDFHCSAYALHTAYPPDPTVYTTGIFDVEVIGPPPTVDLFTHGVKFVSGGWSQARITGTERRFLGSEDDYWAGEAPITNPPEGETVFVWDHGDLDMSGYTIAGFEGTYDGFWCKDNHATLQNITISDVRKAFRHDGRSPATISNSTFTNADVGLSCESHIPSVNNLTIRNSGVGIELSENASPYGTLNGIVFEEVDIGIKGASNNRVVLNYPDFRHCDTPVDSLFANLILQNEVGYRD